MRAWRGTFDLDEVHAGGEVGLRLFVVVEDLLVAQPADGEDEGRYQARAILARRAVEQHRMVARVAADSQDLRVSCRVVSCRVSLPRPHTRVCACVLCVP